MDDTTERHLGRIDGPVGHALGEHVSGPSEADHDQQLADPEGESRIAQGELCEGLLLLLSKLASLSRSPGAQKGPAAKLSFEQQLAREVEFRLVLLHRSETAALTDLRDPLTRGSDAEEFSNPFDTRSKRMDQVLEAQKQNIRVTAVGMPSRGVFEP